MIADVPKGLDPEMERFCRSIKTKLEELSGSGDELKKAETRESLKNLGLVIKRNGKWSRTDDTGDPV